MRWTDRLIGIISTLILARLLTPADFGIVAMASLVVALTDTLLDLGAPSALIQNRNVTRDDFDTAWTLRLIQAILAALLIALVGAPLAVDYFKDARVEDVLRVMAISVAIGGLENIGIVTFQKNMEFGRDFQFFFIRRISGFLVTLALALWLRNYWAMVWGALAGRVIGVVLSYVLHAYRPSFSFSRLRSLWSFSQWILVRNVGSYGAQQSDKLLVGRMGDSNALGAYSLADEISAMPSNEVLMPLGRVLFPAFARVADDPHELRRIFLLALGVQATVALPAGVGLALVASLAVPVLLGSQWTATIPLIHILALMNAAGALTHSSGYLLLALGKVRLQAILAWVQFAALLTLALLVFRSGEPTVIAGIRLAVAFTVMSLLFAMVLRAVPVLKARDLLSATWRPIVASAIMAVALFLVPHLGADHPLFHLIAEIILGALIYMLSILLLWRLAGLPHGAESYLLEIVGIKQQMQR